MSVVGADRDALEGSARALDVASGELRRSLTTVDDALHALAQPDIWSWTVQQAARWSEDAAGDQRWRAHVLDDLDQPVPDGADLAATAAQRLGVFVSPLLVGDDAAARTRMTVGLAVDRLAELPSSAATAFAERFGALARTDGLALTTRAALNHQLIATAIDDARRERSAAVAAGDTTAVARLDRFLGWAEPLLGRTVLLWDAEHRVVAVAQGDLQAFDAVAVHIGPAGSDVEHWDRLDAQMQTVHDAATDDGAHVLSIAFVWEAPDNAFDAWRSERSIWDAADEVSAFVRSLALAPTVRTSLVGLDIGAVVAGMAGTSLDRLDAVVGVGAPGMGALHADDITRASGAEVYAGRAPEDGWTMWNRNPAPFLDEGLTLLAPEAAPIWALAAELLDTPRAPQWGPDPTTGDFGAFWFQVGRRPGHGHYFEPGSPAVDQVGAIVAGRTDRLHEVDNHGLVDSFRVGLDDTFDGLQWAAGLEHTAIDNFLDREQQRFPGFVQDGIDEYQALGDAVAPYVHTGVDEVQLGVDKVLGGAQWTLDTSRETIEAGARVVGYGVDAGGDLVQVGTGAVEAGAGMISDGAGTLEDGAEVVGSTVVDVARRADPRSWF